MSLKTLVLGCISSPHGINHRPYANVPGSLWLKGFCQGLQANGARVELISHVPDRAFPYGKLFPQGEDHLDSEFPTRCCSYVNTKGLRPFTLARQYIAAVRESLKREPSDLLITYNPSSQHIAAGRWLTQNTKTKWISILLDPPEQNFDADWQRYIREYGPASAYVFLSWSAFQDFPLSNKHHLDAGALPPVASEKPCFQKKPYTLLYSGKLEPTFGGSGLFLEFFREMRSPDFRFVLCGKTRDQRIIDAAAKDERIDLRGFVPDDTLHDLCKEADGFFNIRPPDHPDSPFIFPSKLLFYLKYQKPVFSLHTSGIAPHYQDLIYFPEENTPEGLAALVESFPKTGLQTWPARQKRLSHYLLNDGTWKSKTHVLLNFCKTL